MRRLLLSTGLGLALGATALAGPAAAQADDAPAPVQVTRAAPAEARPEPIPVPERDLDVMTIRCEIDGLATGCVWRATSAEGAVGYQLWRIVDRDARELVWRGGLDITSARDRLPRDAQVVRYAVIAVDENGRVVGQSRPVTLTVEDDRPPIDPQPIDPQPIDAVGPVAIGRTSAVLTYR